MVNGQQRVAVAGPAWCGPAELGGGQSSPFSAFHPHGSGGGCEARGEEGPGVVETHLVRCMSLSVTMSSLVRKKISSLTKEGKMTGHTLCLSSFYIL